MALCNNTFFWTDSSGKTRESPCGKCWICLSNKRREWSFRAFQESKNAYSQAFITLTYNPYEIPLTGEIDENGEEIFTLAKNDLRLFLMKLRTENGRMNKASPTLLHYGFKTKKMSYYAIGEYGDQFNRPHYHLILFNFHPALKDVIAKKWDKGFFKIAPVNTRRINYVTSYVITKNIQPTDKQAPFCFISNGFGAEFLKSALKTFMQTEDLKVQHKDGRIMKMPRYYRDRILTTPELKMKFNYQAEFEKKMRLKRYNLIDEAEKVKLNPFNYEKQIKDYDLNKLANYRKKRKK